MLAVLHQKGCVPSPSRFAVKGAAFADSLSTCLFASTTTLCSSTCVRDTRNCILIDHVGVGVGAGAKTGLGQRAGAGGRCRGGVCGCKVSYTSTAPRPTGKVWATSLVLA